MRIRDWSSDVCSSDLFAKDERHPNSQHQGGDEKQDQDAEQVADERDRADDKGRDRPYRLRARDAGKVADRAAELAEPFHHQDSLPLSFFQISSAAHGRAALAASRSRSEEHTSELQSLMRISYAVFCLKKKKQTKTKTAT